jgi:hypothetical protein
VVARHTLSQTEAATVEFAYCRSLWVSFAGNKRALEGQVDAIGIANIAAK